MESNGIKGQSITDVLQQGGTFCGAAQVLNHWKKSEGKDHFSMHTVKHHTEKFMQARKLKCRKLLKAATTHTYHGPEQAFLLQNSLQFSVANWILLPHQIHLSCHHHPKPTTNGSKHTIMMRLRIRRKGTF
eukprot:1870255-Ditylum_brightwellii.AAC.1